jgi:hypothetical protein
VSELPHGASSITTNIRNETFDLNSTLSREREREREREGASGKPNRRSSRFNKRRFTQTRTFGSCAIEANPDNRVT